MDSSSSRLLAILPIPDAAAPVIMQCYQYRAPDTLALNPSCAPFSMHVPSADFIKDRLSSSPAALEAVLASNDVRSAVLAAVLDEWDLSVTDQQRFTSRHLSTTIANRVLTSSFTPEATSRALAYVSPTTRLLYLAQQASSAADALYEALCAAEEHTATHHRRSC
jgi:hypothetical protein